MIKVLSQVLLFSALFLGVSLCPQKMTKLDHRIFWSQPLRIVMPKTSPAHAALEDLKEELFKEPPPQSQNHKQTIRQLASGEYNAHDLLKFRTLIDTKTKQEARSIRLAGVVVREFKAEALNIAKNQLNVRTPEIPKAYFEQRSQNTESSSSDGQIRGRVELKEGLALWDPNMQLRIKQIVDGQTVAETQAQVDDGQFVLPTQTSGGTIIAELVNSQNQVYGAGTMATPVGRKSAVLPVLPSQQGLLAKVTSARSHGGETFAIDQGTLSILGAPAFGMKAEHKVSYNEPMIENGSQVLLQAAGDKHNTTLAMGLAGKAWDISVLPKSMSKAMLNLSLDEADRYGADDLGMVWGKVVSKGEPVKGARVQISDGVEPIYFNELLLPDKNLQSTSSNGMFAFVKLNAGIKSIRVFQNDRVAAAEIMPVDIQHVSQISFDLLDDKNLNCSPQAYGFSEKPPVLFTQVLGLEVEQTLESANTTWKLPRSNHPLWMEFNAGPEYEKTRQLVLPAQENLDIPVFKRLWVDNILQQNGMQREAYSATIIGFGPASEFTVETASGQVLYLTRDHKVTPYGTPNGAFIITNMKSDIQVVNVVDQQTGLRWIQTVVAEPDITTVLIHPRAE